MSQSELYKGTNYGKEGLVFSGTYDMAKKLPIDSRETVETVAGLYALSDQSLAYDGLVVFCKQHNAYYRYVENAGTGTWENLAGVFFDQNTEYDEDTETFKFCGWHPTRAGIVENIKNS